MIKIYELGKMTGTERERIMQRSVSDTSEAEGKVEEIIDNVRKNGDKALIEYKQQFDGVEVANLRVTEDEFDEAFKIIDPGLLARIKDQIKWSSSYHRNQISKTWQTELEKGVTAGQKTTPIESVGLYVPGGRATYPTVMQVLGVPAGIAGVPRIVAVTPPNEEGGLAPAILAAAKLAGVTEVYKVGGAQAIAALAYGTESIKPVKKIVGPGNIYVTAAKLKVFGRVAIDMPAGPSEAIILADKYANPKYCAIDILARTEHDPNAAGVLVTDSMELAKATAKEVEIQFQKLNRREIMKEALSKYCAIMVTKNMDEAIRFTNDYAPEHLELMVRDPWDALNRIENAGSVFMGDYAPVAVGDYATGTNHILPTGGYAKMFSPVSVSDFQKKTEFQYLTKEGLKNLEPIVSKISDIEGLDAHGESVRIRFKDGKYPNTKRGQKKEDK